jgi:hypothetical protein
MFSSYISQFLKSISEPWPRKTADLIEPLTHQELAGERQEGKREREAEQTTLVLADGYGLACG